MFEFLSIQIFESLTGFIVYEKYLEEQYKSSFLLNVINNFNYNTPFSSVIIDRQDLLNEDETIPELLLWPDLPVRLVRELVNIPYRVHGGREFDLMIKGIKPLSVYRNVLEGSSVYNFIMSYFEDDRFFIEKYKDDQALELNSFDYFIVNSSDKWRIEVYQKMIKASMISGWNDSLEYLQGYLLGYADNHRSIWMDTLQRSGNRWGFHAMYVFLSEEEAESIRISGFKVFLNIKNEFLTVFFPIKDNFYIKDCAKILSLQSKFCAKMYVPLYKMIRYRSTELGEGEDIAQIFRVPRGELNLLNEVIDGTIQIKLL